MKIEETAPVEGGHRELFADGGLSGEGELKDEKRHGKWTFYFKSGGLKATGHCVAGELDGYWEWWRENGQPLQGEWKVYEKTGLLKSKKNFR